MDISSPPTSGPTNVPAAQRPLFLQATVARAASVEGIGIHTGRPATLRLLPAPPDTGIVFRRTDARGIEIPARCSHVVSLDLATTLGRDDVTVSTIEHLMAALHMVGVDNLIAEIDGPEIPILDGSARPFLKLLEATGIQHQNATRKAFVVTEPVELEHEDKWIRVTPYPGLRITYTLDYEIESIGRQELELDVDLDSFAEHLSAARTFGLRRDIDRLHAMGLGLGGREDNCVVFSVDGPTNTELRFPDEPVRHKALDAVGDFALLGAPLWGHIEVKRGGHLLHYLMMKKLLDQEHTWTWARFDRSEAVRQPGLAAEAHASANLQID